MRLSDVGPVGRDESAPEQVWLLGQPPLSDYLDFVRDAVVGGSGMPRARLVDEWRTANDYWGELEAASAPEDVEAEVRDLPRSLRGLAKQVAADTRYQETFDTLPTRIAMVELDRLLVSQPFVNRHHTARLASRLGPAPSPEQLFRFCLPLDREEATVEARKAGSRRWLFWSDSSDFRFHEPVLLAPGQISGHKAFGPVCAALALVVGYGSNFFSAIESDRRLVIHNGYHRAYAMRELGITHAPCIVQSVTRLEELKLAASRAVLDDPAFYFRAKRPPLLRDFFDPRTSKVLPVERIVHAVSIDFEVKQFSTKELSRTG